MKPNLVIEETKGIDKRFTIRRDLRNKKLWVFEVYYADIENNVKSFRAYPNFISSRYLTKQSCKKAIEDYKVKGSLGLSWDDEKK
jgi:hypothetical protein